MEKDGLVFGREFGGIGLDCCLQGSAEGDLSFG